MIIPTPEEILRISDLITAANSVGEAAVDFCLKRLDACIAIGKQFLEWKKQAGHGKWEAFAAEHFPQLPSSTRKRWQQLAEADMSGKYDRGNWLGLRDAYIKVGILPEPPPSPKSESGRPVSYLRHIDRIVVALQRIAVDELEAGEQKLLKERLRPIVTLFYQINPDSVGTP